MSLGLGGWVRVGAGSGNVGTPAPYRHCCHILSDPPSADQVGTGDLQTPACSPLTPLLLHPADPLSPVTPACCRQVGGHRGPQCAPAGPAATLYCSDLPGLLIPPSLSRWAGTEDLNARLLALAGAWGGGDDAPNLLSCARSGGGPLKKVRGVGVHALVLVGGCAGV